MLWAGAMLWWLELFSGGLSFEEELKSTGGPQFVGAWWILVALDKPIIHNAPVDGGSTSG